VNVDKSGARLLRLWRGRASQHIAHPEGSRLHFR